MSRDNTMVAEGNASQILREDVALCARDGHTLAAYRVEPTAMPARREVVVLQEIYGLTPHIRRVCDRFAESGYAAVAPALQAAEAKA